MVDDHLGALVKDRIPDDLPVFPTEPLGRKGDGGQGIFDLVGDSSGNLPPGRHPLGLFLVRQVVEDHDQAEVPPFVVPEGVDVNHEAAGPVIDGEPERHRDGAFPGFDEFFQDIRIQVQILTLEQPPVVLCGGSPPISD